MKPLLVKPILTLFLIISPTVTSASGSSSGSGGASPTIGGGKTATVVTTALEKSNETIRKKNFADIQKPGVSNFNQSFDQRFDHRHAVWSDLLKSHVKYNSDRTSSTIDYQNINTDKLGLYLKSLSGLSDTDFIRFTKQEKLAFLINAYNAFTVSLVKEHLPLKSIKSIGGVFRSPWKISFIQLRGQLVNLDRIEHEWIRGNPELMDPRIHFALNCASIGCPALRAEAFDADQLDAQLTDSTVQFLKDPSRNRYRKEKNVLEVSALFDWFQEDFGDVRLFLKKYGVFAEGSNLKYLPYDWDLNDTK